MKFLAYLLFPLLLLTQSGIAQVSDSDETAIYRVLFSGMGTVVLRKPDLKAKPSADYSPAATEMAEAYVSLKNQFPQAEDATISNYLRHNHPVSLTPDSKVGVKLVFIEPMTFDQICESGTDSMWTPFQKRFPGANIVTECRFSFNPTRTQAFVLMFCSLDADPRLYLLEKHNRKWIVNHSIVESSAW